MKRLATNPDEGIVRIPDIVSVVVIVVQPALAIRVVVHIERATIPPEPFLRETPPVTPSFEYSRD